jgi:hypothetical protein
MNLTKIIELVCDEVTTAQRELAKRGIKTGNVDVTIEPQMIGMSGGAEYARSVTVLGIGSLSDGCGGVMQPNDPSSATPGQWT